MRFAAIAAVVGASLGLVYGAVLPVPVPGTEAGKPLDNDMSPRQQALQALSSVFGYQLAGIAPAPGKVLLSCQDLKNMGKEGWDNFGLNTSMIQGPICTTAEDDVNSTYAITNSIVAHSHLLTTQLLNSFNGTGRFDKLCDDLRLDLIEYFPANGAVVKQAVCEHSSYNQMAPQPFHTPLPIPTAAVTAAKNTESMLFAIMLASGMKSSTELSAACGQASHYTKYLNSEHMNGTAVVETLCNVKNPIAVHQGKALLRKWMTRYYITVLENISNVDGWMSWLCDNVDVEKMNAVGLKGIDVQQRVCLDAKASNATKRASE